jgi:hypothetical protein
LQNQTSCGCLMKVAAIAESAGWITRCARDPRWVSNTTIETHKRQSRLGFLITRACENRDCFAAQNIPDGNPGQALNPQTAKPFGFFNYGRLQMRELGLLHCVKHPRGES